MAELNDDDGVIAAMPDLQIEVSHTEDMLILQQTDYSGQTDRLAIHRWQVRFLAEQMGLLPAATEGEAEARRQVATLTRRMLLLHSRMAQLHAWLAEQPDYEAADINVEVSYSAGTMALADEFLADMPDGRGSSALASAARPRSTPAQPLPATARAAKDGDQGRLV